MCKDMRTEYIFLIAIYNVKNLSLKRNQKLNFDCIKKDNTVQMT